MLALPLTPEQALERVSDWFEQDHVVGLDPGPRNLMIVLDRTIRSGAILTVDPMRLRMAEFPERTGSISITKSGKTRSCSGSFLARGSMRARFAALP